MSDELAREISVRLNRIEAALKLNVVKPNKRQWVDADEISRRTEWNDANKKRKAREKHLVFAEIIKETDCKNGKVMRIYRYDLNSVPSRYFINQNQSA